MHVKAFNSNPDLSSRQDTIRNFYKNNWIILTQRNIKTLKTSEIPSSRSIIRVILQEIKLINKET